MCASSPRHLTLLLALVATLLVPPAVAADKDPAKEQTRRMQQAQRKLEQEKAQLARDKGALETEVGTLRKKSEDAERLVDQAGKESAALRRARDALKTKLAETEATLAETRASLLEAQTEGTRLKSALTAEKLQLTTCTARNAEMHEAGINAIARYEAKGCFDATLQAEPFTGLKRVEIENAVEDMRERLDAQRFEARREVSAQSAQSVQPAQTRSGQGAQ
jgi:hypothetical protein